MCNTPLLRLRTLKQHVSFGIRPYARYEHIYDAFFFDGGRDFFFFDEPPPFRRRWTKRIKTATRAAATKDAPMARWCFTMPVSSGTRGTSPASKSCAREHKFEY